MGLEDLKKQIVADFEKEVDAIKKKNKEEVDAILADAQTECKAYAKSKEELLSKEKEEMTRREEALFELDGSKILQEAKRKAIDNVFEKLKKKLMSMSAKERTDILKKLLESAKKEINVKKVYVSKSDLANLKSEKPQEVDILGGLIAENADGTVRIDYSFDSMLVELRSEQLSKVSGVLF